MNEIDRRECPRGNDAATCEIAVCCMACDYYYEVPSLEDIQSEMDKFDKMIVKSFSGVSVRVDPELKGNEHYLVVSQEMFDKIKKERSYENSQKGLDRYLMDLGLQ